MKLLLTGPSGRVGPCLVEAFRPKYDLVTFDLPGCGADFEGDLTDIAPLQAAMRGCEVVIHLAAVSDEAPFVEKLVPSNIIGVFNILEAARLEGVRRVVFASSCQAIFGWHRREPKKTGVEVEDGPRPSTLYGATKVMAETMGRFYHDKHGLEFVGIRIGAFQPYDSEWLAKGRGEFVWLSPRDCVQIFERAIETPDVGWAVVNATSQTSQSFMSLEGARDRLGFVPIDHTRDFFPPQTFEK